MLMDQEEFKIRARFFNRIDIRGISECWLYKGDGSHKTGRYHVRKRNLYADRYMYSLFHKELLQHEVLRKTCLIRRCCNPYHFR